VSEMNIITILIIAGVTNVVLMFSLFGYVMYRVAKCTEETMRTREAAGTEYKALAERVTSALIQIGHAIGNLTERLPPQPMKGGTTALMPRQS